MREDQLRQKKMIVEADSLRKLAINYRPNFEKLSETEMALFAGGGTLKEAFNAYLKYISKNKPSNKVECVLANRIFITGKFELTDKKFEEIASGDGLYSSYF